MFVALSYARVNALRKEKCRSAEAAGYRGLWTLVEQVKVHVARYRRLTLPTRHGGAAMPSSGVLYAAESENANLATEIYGTTYASEAFVRDAVRHASGDDRTCVRLPRALANEQDLYVVALSNG